MTTDTYYLNIARAVAQKSPCLKKHYGAVIVNNSEIISTGYNGPPRGEPHCTVCKKADHGKDMSTFCTCQSVHAEMNAIISAARKDMIGSTLYLAGFDGQSDFEVCAEPCEICLRLIKNAGIDKVINISGVMYERDASGLIKKGKN